MRWLLVVACIEAALCFRLASVQGPMHAGAWPPVASRQLVRSSAWRLSVLHAKAKSADQPRRAFERLVHVKAVHQGQLLGARIAATEEECRAIAEKALVFAVHHFQANVTLSRLDGPTIKVAGNLAASFTAVKGAPVSTVNATFSVAALDKTVGTDVDMFSMDNPYMFESNKEGRLDIANICYNFFVLNMGGGD